MSIGGLYLEFISLTLVWVMLFWLVTKVKQCEQMLSGDVITSDTKTLLLPINIDNQHYVLAIVDIQSTTVWLYDPLGVKEANLPIAEQISAVFGHHLRQHFDSKLFQGPLQDNSHDCGILVINTAIAIARGRPLAHLTNADCQQIRAEAWQTLLRLWWQEQRVNGTDTIHRARGAEEAFAIDDTERILIDISADSANGEGALSIQQHISIHPPTTPNLLLTRANSLDNPNTASKSAPNDIRIGMVKQKRAPIEKRRPPATAAARTRPLSAEKNKGARRGAQQRTEAAGTRLNNSTTQHTNVHKHTTQADDIAQGPSKNNATKWWRRGFLVEPSYKIGNSSTEQEAAEGSLSTLGLRMPSRPQLEEFQDTTAKVDSIQHSNSHAPGD